MEPKYPQFPFITREMLEFGNQSKIDLEVVSSDTSYITFQVSGLTRSAPFTFDITPDGAGDTETRFLGMNDIPIAISVHSPIGFHQKGDLFVNIYLRINETRVMKLISGLLQSGVGLTYPATVHSDPMDGRQFLRTLGTNNPAAGAEMALTVPAAEVWEIIAIQIPFVANGTVASRRPHITFGIGSASVDFELFGDTDITASQNRTITAATFGFSEDRADDDDILIALPHGIVLSEGDVIATDTTNLQAGDNIGLCRVHGYKFLNPLA